MTTKTEKVEKVVVLLSGGIDSALALAREAPFCVVHALSIDYGQSHYLELDAACELAAHYEVEHRVAKIDLGFATDVLIRGGEAIASRTLEEIRKDVVSPSYVPARNTIFVSLALAWAETLKASRVILCANADDKAFPDCRPEFVDAICRVSYLGTTQQPKVKAPFINQDKINTQFPGKSKRDYAFF